MLVFFLPLPKCKHDISSWFVKTVNYQIWIYRNVSRYENDHRSADEVITSIRREIHMRIDVDNFVLVI